eukprot:4028641-Karenia_brevis.AAC.1
MATSANQIKDRFEVLLEKPVPNCCKMCGAKMSGPSCHVMDGGQAYETIRLGAVKNDLRFVLGLAE